jgi:hypothetical protein
MLMASMNASTSSTTSAASDSRNPAQQQQDLGPPVSLQDLPREPLELIALYASSPTTPAACLLPLVGKDWRAAADRLPVDISLARLPQPRIPSPGGLAAYPEVLRSTRVAAWLTKYKGRVRSLCVPRYLGMGEIEGVCIIYEALAAQQQGPVAAGPPLPHLVQLELPFLGLRHSGAFQVSLAACTGLQRLTLNQDYGLGQPPECVDMLSGALARLTRLRALRVRWTRYNEHYVKDSIVEVLLRRLPPSLEHMEATGLIVFDLPLSCVTHLVNLRVWDGPDVHNLHDDISSSSSSPITTTTSSSSGGRGMQGPLLMTALTKLRFPGRVKTQDARLQFPNLSAVRFGSLEPGVWQQLHSMRHLQQVTVLYGAYRRSQQSHDEFIAGLSGLSRLQQLQLHLVDTEWTLGRQLLEPWAACIGGLTCLNLLRLSSQMVMSCQPSMFMSLVQLKHLTTGSVFQAVHPPEFYYPRGATAPADALVMVLADAAASGWRPLQQLVLVVYDEHGWPERDVQKVTAGAKAALPGLQVEVQSTVASYRQGYSLSARLAAHALTRHWLVCKGTAAQQACSEHVIRVPVWQLLSVPEGGCPSHRQAVHSQALARCNQLSIQAGSFMMHVRVRRPPLQCCCCMC